MPKVTLRKTKGCQERENFSHRFVRIIFKKSGLWRAVFRELQGCTGFHNQVLYPGAIHGNVKIGKRRENTRGIW